ncbi:patatin-like phospholipase family protein [Paenibacillus sp. y28]|uniref:patatin-like phospholipase family protein n=1 Tax=Paenibacillus sp. y28 TaxID=3129110 RepID=UPI00301A3836
MKINAVFEGGGVKAIGLVGALQAAQEKGIQFERVAGTSSGSMVASMLAAGYTPEEMRDIIASTPFTSFIKKGPLHQIRIIGPAVRLFIKKGLYSGEALERWMAHKLAAKGVRTFADLKPGTLKIVASDISQGKLLVLPDDIEQYGWKPAQLSVARAVRMSTSIPYFFDPVILRKPFQKQKPQLPFAQQFVYVVDGGLLSNFPLWLFDREESPKVSSVVPTLGFQLVGISDSRQHQIRGPLSMLTALFSTMMEAHDQRYIEQHNVFRTIKIPTLGVRVTDFDISPEKSMALYDSGLEAGRQYFSSWTVGHYVQEMNKVRRMQSAAAAQQQAEKK